MTSDDKLNFQTSTRNAAVTVKCPDIEVLIVIKTSNYERFYTKSLASIIRDCASVLILFLQLKTSLIPSNKEPKPQKLF